MFSNEKRGKRRVASKYQIISRGLNGMGGMLQTSPARCSSRGHRTFPDKHQILPGTCLSLSSTSWKERIQNHKCFSFQNRRSFEFLFSIFFVEYLGRGIVQRIPPLLFPQIRFWERCRPPRVRSPRRYNRGAQLYRRVL